MSHNQETRNVIIIVLLMCLPVFIFSIAAGNIGYKKYFAPTPEPKVVGSAIGFVSQPIYTNTPNPTETEEPTKTPFPTIVQESGKIEGPQSDLRVFEPSPYPTYTPFPTWTHEPTLTQSPMPEPTKRPAGLIALENDILLKMRSKNLKMSVSETLLSPIAFGFYAIVFLGLLVLLIINRFNKLIELQLTAKSGHEVIEKLEVDESPYAHPLYPDWRGRVNFLRKQIPPVGPTEIVQDLWPQNKSGGGSHFKLVKAVLKMYDPAGEFGPRYRVTPSTTSPPHVSPLPITTD